MGNEWAWFRASLLDALVRPRRFARTLAREHYGLAGVLIALVAGVALSISVDVAVILSKGADPLALLSRLSVDAFLVGWRVVIATAVLGLLATVVARLARRAIGLDQAFTAVAFATAPLLAAPLVVVLLVLANEVGPARGVVLVLALTLAVVLAARLVLGIALNLAALAGRASVLVIAAALVAGAIVLQDQLGRIVFTALTYAPQLLPPAAPVAADALEARLDGARFHVTVGWTEASRGVPGVAAQYERPDARLTVHLRSVPILTTADAFAAGEAQAARRAFTRIDRATRDLVRIDDAAAVDDRWSGVIDEQRISERLYTFVVGTRGYVFEFEFFAPTNEEAAQAEAARIAASIRLGR